ncbi:MAG: CAP domain-containing protein [bacterium]|nr:CAP domain-containing protein [bacterium]
MKRFVFLVLVLWFFEGALIPAAQMKKEDYFNAQRIERKLLDLVNKERKEKGYFPLLQHAALSDIAFKHSQKMSKERKLSHRFPNYKTLEQRLMDAGLFFLRAGENIAFSGVILGKNIHQKFMGSIGHRQNLLDPGFTHCGIRLARSGDDYYVTQVFARLYTPLKDEEMASRIEDHFKSRYQNEFNNQVVFYSRMKPHARTAAKMNAEGKKLDTFLESLPDQWGKLRIVNLTVPGMEQVKEELEKEMVGKSYVGAAIGVSRTRSLKFPGGAYAVSVLLVETLAGDWTEERLRSAVLATINQEREKNRLPLLELEKRFKNQVIPIPELTASSWKEKYRKQLQAIYRRTGQNLTRVFTFTTHEPGNVPGNILEGLVELGEKVKRIGIHVHLPTNNDSPDSRLLVVTLIF